MHIHSFQLELGNINTLALTIQIVTERTKNDVNGNPIYLATVLTDNDGDGSQWSPDALRITRKDGKLRIQSYLGHAGVAQQVFDKLQAYYKEGN